jgi:hypothetical protein
MKYNLLKSSKGYRFNLWIPGSLEDTGAIINRLHFDLSDGKNCEHYLGVSEIFLYRNKSKKNIINLLQFHNLKTKVRVLFEKSCKRIFIAYYENKGFYTLLSGSHLGKNTNISQEFIHYDRVADVLCKNIIFKSENKLLHSVGYKQKE